ncbi:t-SNARE affecting a late Golgi compartment protein 2 [Hypsizygus marmoreus]|uniref:t-SNARE affecting a late Golgi compartment protein 2 n=1 Tax=Hypsizygus marmoreus TaxID=39966 RepID=A0A369JBI4_HYPMA|nr:t-SNARE affecting a late Golgi compartment protein 2 [Hypsizygus marmoreus]
MSSSSSSSSSSAVCTTRSRTGLFLSYRESIPRSRPANYEDDDEHEHLISTPRHIVLDVPLPPQWVDFAEQVEFILVDTKAKITALDKLHAKHVLPGFSDRTHEEREINALTTDITRDFRQCQSLIQKIGLPTHAFPPPQDASQHSEALAAKNVQRGLAVKVQDLSAAFRKKQRVYMEKLQGHAIKNQDLLIASGAISLKGSEGMSAVDDDIAAATHTQSQSLSLSQSQTQTLLSPNTYDQDTITSRTHSLNELAKSISGLAELFKDLSTLIIDQGTLLDSVEYNIEQTAVSVGEAVVVLREAKGYQGRTGRRRCMLLLFLMVLALVVVLVVKLRARGKTSVSVPTTGADVPVVTAVGARYDEATEFDPWELGRRPISSRVMPRGRRREVFIRT